MNKKIALYIENCIAKKIFPGCVLGVLSPQGNEIVAAGTLTYDSLSPAVTPTTIYDVASITKSIPTACLALQLIEQGKLTLDSRVIDFVPEYGGNFRDDIKVSHLLNHTLDFDFQLSEKKDLPPQEILGLILSAQLRRPPGTSFFYANATSILLGLVIERVGDGRLDKLARDHFFKPLGMQDTGFSPDAALVSRIAPTENDPWRKREIRGEVHDESAWALRPLLTTGSAGLFSTVPDMLKFVAMLLHDGEAGGRRYFEPQTIALMHTNALPENVVGTAAFGWELNNPQYMGCRRQTTTFGKTGFTGCTIVADPVRQAGYVMLTNHIYPRRRENRNVINEVRATIAEYVLEGNR